MAPQQNGADQRSWWRKVFGRSLLKAVVGDFFDSRRNTASIIGIMLVGTLCYVVLFREKYEYMAVVINLAFAVSGFYFASRVGRRDDADDDEGK